MAKGGFPRMGGGANMNNMLKQAQKMQQDLLKAQEELEDKNVEASVGGGAVTVTVSGKKEVVSIKINPDVIDPDDAEMLEDLIVAAVNEGLRKADELASSTMGKITQGMNLPGMGMF